MFAWSDSLRCRRSCGSLVGEGSTVRRRAGIVAAEVAEQLLELRQQAVADHAGDADDHPRRRVPPVDVIGERLAVRRLDRVACAERLPAERVRAEEQLFVDRADVVPRRVVVHVHLLEDHALLALDLLGVELGVAEHVDEHVERDVALLTGAADVVAGVLLRRERVELTADLVDLHREVARGRAALGSLEEHVLREVGDPAVGRLLVARAGSEHDVAGDRLRVVERRGQDAQAVRQRVAFDRRSCSDFLLGICRPAARGHAGDAIDHLMPGETHAAVHRQPEWLGRVPTDRRLPAGARVVHTGCGTSFHAAQTGGDAVQALEAVLDPPQADIMVCVSHEGGTELTLEAARAFAGDIWLVTGKAASPLAELAKEVIVATPEVERSWCHTASYTCAIAAIDALHGREIGWLPAAVAGRALGRRRCRTAGARARHGRGP